MRRSGHLVWFPPSHLLHPGLALPLCLWSSVCCQPSACCFWWEHERSEKLQSPHALCVPCLDLPTPHGGPRDAGVALWPVINAHIVYKPVWTFPRSPCGRRSISIAHGNVLGYEQQGNNLHIYILNRKAGHVSWWLCPHTCIHVDHACIHTVPTQSIKAMLYRLSFTHPPTSSISPSAYVATCSSHTSALI